jgi:FAD binding domain-containing protein/berberine-like enzyme
MKLIIFFILLTLAVIGTVAKGVQGPVECKVISGDPVWPAPAIWSQELPGVKEQKSSQRTKHANYRFDINSIDQVVAAINFTKKYKVRLSILNSGHDFHGRNDAPNGLVLVLTGLKGIRILPNFIPTEEGVKSVNSRTKDNTAPPRSDQAYVTFGAGYSTQELNDLLAPVNLFTVGAAHGSVSVAGGWAQTAGHAPLSAHYGLGVDQIMEYKVVTADGVLKVANAVSNPDLFWALRGGGGGTFGVVVEATVKAYVSPKVAVAVAWLNTTNSNDTRSIWPALTWLHTQIPAMAENGMTMYYYITPSAMTLIGINGGENGTRTWLRQNWKPVVQNLGTFNGMNNDSLIYVSLKYSNYKAFFDYIFNPDRKMQGLKGLNAEHTTDLNRALLPRHGPGEVVLTQPQGVSWMDSWLLGKEHLTSPGLSKALEGSMPHLELGELRGQMVGGGKVFQAQNNTSVLPAWRKTYSHLILVGSGQADATPLRKLAPNMGQYVNEGSRLTPDWRNAFWGSNYNRLSDIKKKYDPEHLFWVTPGIDADAWVVRDQRLCKTTPTNMQSAAELATEIAPKGDNLNFVDTIKNNDETKGPSFLLIKYPNGTEYFNPEYQDDIDNNPTLLLDEGE